MRAITLCVGALLVQSTLLGAARPSAISKTGPQPVPSTAQLIFHEVHYRGRLADAEARFTADLRIEASGRGEASATLFEGEVAVPAPRLPVGLRLTREGSQYRLVAVKPGEYRLEVELIAKVRRHDLWSPGTSPRAASAQPAQGSRSSAPYWNEVSFVGPEAAIATVEAKATTEGVVAFLLSGARENGAPAGEVRGVLGADRLVALRWQSKQAAIARETVVTCDTAAQARINPTVVKFATEFRFEIVQGGLDKLAVALPANQALTKVEGEQIRDWQVQSEGGRQMLKLELLRTVAGVYRLTLHTELPVESLPARTQLTVPEPVDVKRETGLLTLTAEETAVEIGTAAGLRQINAPQGALAAYQFYARPFALPVGLNQVEPVVKVASRVTVRLEESRLTMNHQLDLTVEKAGLYRLDLGPLGGSQVTDVRGEGIEEWKSKDDRLIITFGARVLGTRHLEVELEQARTAVPAAPAPSPLPPGAAAAESAATPLGIVSIMPLRVAGAVKETAQIGVGAAAGIQLKTTELQGVREQPVSALPGRSDESLAFAADQGDWSLKLAAERLRARVVAEIFNLVTIGDGLLGGSATIRYALINQGVQEFKVRVPASWRNLEFTGPNIRRKDQAGDIWTISLQDKAWGGYTLVVTYDEQMDARGATLSLGGVHAVDVERETGTIAVTSAASLQLKETTVEGPLRRIDEGEIAATDRDLITHSVLLAYRQSSSAPYSLGVEVSRFEDVPLLSAVADRTQLTTVLTEAGQMLTQASYMVKNNDKDYQRFTLPRGAEFWSCYVDGQAVKAERQNDELLVPLPRGVNRDRAFAVEIVYAQHTSNLASKWGQSLALDAPQTDIQTTYAEWQLYVPPTHSLARFGGNLTVERGATYGLRDAWAECVAINRNVLTNPAVLISLLGGVLALCLVAAARRGGRGLIEALAVVAIVAVLAGMMLPSLAKAKAKGQRINTANNLRQIGVAARMHASESNGRFPASLAEMAPELGTDKVSLETETGQPLVYLGAGKTEADADSILAYSPLERGGTRAVVLVDGSVQQMPIGMFNDAMQRGGRTLSIVDLAKEKTPPASGLAAPPVPQAQVESLSERQELARDRLTSKDEPRAAGRGPTNWMMLMRYGPSSRGFQPGQTPASTAAQAGGGLGAGGFGGGAVLGGAAGVAGKPVVSRVAGIRPVRIDIPRTGQRFLFTKVLNVGQNKLTVQAWAIRTRVRDAARSSAQVSAFLAGVLILWRQWRRPSPSAAIAALGLVLTVVSMGWMLLVTRWLGVGLAVAVLAGAAGLLILLAWNLLRRRQGHTLAANGSANDTGLERGSNGVSPVVPLIVLCLIAPFGRAKEAVAPTGVDASSPQYSILSATYSGNARGSTAEIEAEIRLVTERPKQTIPLLGPEAAVKSFSSLPAEAKLLRVGKATHLWLARKGEAKVKVKFLVSITNDTATLQHNLVFAIPPALSSEAAITVDEPEAILEFPAAVAYHSAASGGRTRVEAVIGAAEQIDLRWSRRAQQAAEIAPTVFSQNSCLVSFRGGAMNLRSQFDLQVAQGEVREMRISLPPGQRPLRVEGGQVLTWQVKEEGQERRLTVRFTTGITGNHRLTIETEKALENLPASVAIEVPHALDVNRESGLAALRASDEVGTTVESVDKAQQVDPADFLKAVPDAGQLAGVFQFLKPEFGLRVRAETPQPQIEAVMRNQVRVGAERVTLRARLDYTIKRAGVFVLRVLLPAEFRVENVTVAQPGQAPAAASDGAAQIQQWVERTEPEGRILELTLKQRLLGTLPLAIRLTRTLTELPASVSVPAVHPLAVKKLAGFVTVSTEVGIEAKAANTEGLTEIPTGTVVGGEPLARGEAGAGTGGLAYRFNSSDPVPSAPPWKLVVSTEALPAWVRTEIVNWWTITENLASGRTQIRFEVQNAPVKEFRVRVPGQFRNVELTGANIRRRDQTTNEWRIELQNKVIGAYLLTVTWETPVAVGEKEAVLVAGGVQAVGVERETGALLVLAQPPLQVTEKAASSELVRIDPSELPTWAGRAEPATVLSYRYLRPGYQLSLGLVQHKAAEVLQALAEEARLTTVVSADGQMMTEMALTMRNNGRQHLEVVLPRGAQVWSSFVAGEAVRPTIRAGHVVVPLEGNSTADGALAVVLTYVGAEKFPAGKGAVELTSPALDVPVKSARWDLYLPADYGYTKFEGTMTRDQDTAAPVVAAFSSVAYTQAEDRKLLAKRREVSGLLSEARRELSEGKNYDASRRYNQARKAGLEEEQVVELKQFDAELRRAQGNNLILAQQQAVDNLNTSFGNLQVPQPAQQAIANPDVQAAERQWEKLQQAQEVAAVKVRPLHVNLPASGRLFSFNQVLQTEVGKPMQVRFWAANTTIPNWPLRTGGVVAALLGSWGLMTFVIGRRARA